VETSYGGGRLFLGRGKRHYWKPTQQRSEVSEHHKGKGKQGPKKKPQIKKKHAGTFLGKVNKKRSGEAKRVTNDCQ